MLYFDEENPSGASLQYALDAWYMAKEKYLPKPGMSEDESEKAWLDYQIWTQRYPINLQKERQEKQKKAAHEAARDSDGIFSHRLAWHRLPCD